MLSHPSLNYIYASLLQEVSFLQVLLTKPSSPLAHLIIRNLTTQTTPGKEPKS
jgi:hypothetical protein